MISLADRIMRRIRSHGRGKWVSTPKNFLDLGHRAAVDKALSRLVKGGVLRRIGRGLYDWPRISGILNRPASPDVDGAVKAIARRDHIRVMPDGIVAANQLGLTNAVPAKTSYVTDGTTRILNVGGRTVSFRHVGAFIMRWSGRLGAPLVQALTWLGRANIDDQVVAQLRSRVPDAVLRDLSQGLDVLPRWMVPIVQSLSSDLSVAT